MFCRYCGNKIRENSNFCLNCGEQVLKDESQAFQSPSQNIEPSGLVNCPDCNKEISRRAKMCPNCGCPIISSSGTVVIKTPCLGSPFLSQNVQIIDNSNGLLLWTGRQGEVARFNVEKPTHITIIFSKSKIASGVQNVEGVVVANKRYTCIQDCGIHMFAKFNLSEVDVIDS